jgi:guanylate kinase
MQETQETTTLWERKKRQSCWTDEDDHALIEMYPKASSEELAKRFPGRTSGAINVRYHIISGYYMSNISAVTLLESQLQKMMVDLERRDTKKQSVIIAQLTALKAKAESMTAYCQKVMEKNQKISQAVTELLQKLFQPTRTVEREQKEESPCKK